METDSDDVIVAHEGGRATVTLDRPGKLNALTGEMFAALGGAFESFAEDPPSVVTVRGAGGNLSAGVDMSGVPGWAEDRPLAVRDELESVHDAIRAIEDLDAPVVAACEGHVLGGGLELALACDIRVAAPDATFGLPESKMGLAMDVGGAQKLPGMVGEGLTKYLVMTGESIGAERALQSGLIEVLAEDGEFAAELATLESSLAEKPTYVHGLAKRQIHGVRPDVETGMALAVHHAIAAYHEDETIERVRGFLGEDADTDADE
ncbi:MAG: enoyl-CoA hydratase/isomerase family protein [Haloarculaceae archaeon]